MKAELRRHLQEYRSRTIAADISEIPAIKSEFYKWYNSVSDEDRAAMQPFWNAMKKEMWDVINEIKALFEEIRALDEAELAEAGKR
ncbi:hypothetical protein SAMN05216327_1054 [Dyadobacter sp. SG02]|uniref:hypothetical protein n=1 Tax=Dyadobacter sp. SG02 TaxID=1855291 RepID=UPI0008C1F282|nr:hypothetical protein [Dyadobacter sp. SG02]SEI96371.1 hypothetical protein SAMN05216327_1054 [Dyadobacter sp. SG02]